MDVESWPQPLSITSLDLAQSRLLDFQICRCQLQLARRLDGGEIGARRLRHQGQTGAPESCLGRPEVGEGSHFTGTQFAPQINLPAHVQ